MEIKIKLIDEYGSLLPSTTKFQLGYLIVNEVLANVPVGPKHHE